MTRRWRVAVALLFVLDAAAGLGLAHVFAPQASERQVWGVMLLGTFAAMLLCLFGLYWALTWRR